MTRPPSIKQLLASGPLIMPTAHDALSAMLIERAGYRAMFMGGFGALATRYALPDIGIAGLSDLSAAARDMKGAISVPLLVDADDGYGDVKSVTRTVRTYEAMGVAGLMLEDQAAPKRCGHMAGPRKVLPMAEAEAKLKAALDARRSDDFFIVARTDARNALGFEPALERGHRFAALGADGLYFDATASEDELATIGRSFALPLMVNNAERSRGPCLPRARLVEMGFSLIVSPTAVLWRVVMATRQALEDLKNDALEVPEGFPRIDEMGELLGTGPWGEIDAKFAATPGSPVQP